MVNLFRSHDDLQCTIDEMVRCNFCTIDGGSRCSGLFVKSNKAFIRLKNANDDIKKAKNKMKKSNRGKILPLIALSRMKDDDDSNKKLGEAANSISFESFTIPLEGKPCSMEYFTISK